MIIIIYTTYLIFSHMYFLIILKKDFFLQFSNQIALTIKKKLQEHYTKIRYFRLYTLGIKSRNFLSLFITSVT